MDKILQVKNISKRFKDTNHEVVALNNISFDLNKSEDLAIIGPSGSGKTTLLQIISGLSDPTDGQVLIDGKKVNSGNDNQVSEFRNETIGFIFQNIYLQEYFTALENVMLPMLVKNTPKKVAREKAEKLLTMVGLNDRMHHRPSKLSGGEEQRVAIARALANDPKIIMADEPTAKLDRSNRDKVIDIFRKISDQGISLIIITHDEHFSQVCPNVIHLEHGKVKNKNF